MEKHKPIITTSNLKQSYDNKTLVLQGIDLDIYPGQIIGYIGPNGAGKTTTVKILTGMLSGFTGSVTILGYDMEINPNEVKKRIGYIPENVALYDTLTPLEYLGFIGQLYEMREKEIEEKANKIGQLELEINNLNFIFKNMKNSIPSSVILINKENMITNWNKKAEEMFGMEPDKTIGADIFELELLKDERINDALNESRKNKKMVTVKSVSIKNQNS